MCEEESLDRKDLLQGLYLEGSLYRLRKSNGLNYIEIQVASFHMFISLLLVRSQKNCQIEIYKQKLKEYNK